MTIAKNLYHPLVYFNGHNRATQTNVVRLYQKRLFIMRNDIWPVYITDSCFSVGKWSYCFREANEVVHILTRKAFSKCLSYV